MTDRKVEGSILRLRCSDGTDFVYFQFSGENDVQTWQLDSLCSLGGNEVILAEMSDSEWGRLNEGGRKEFEKRISSQLGRTDLRYVDLVRVVENGPQGGGISFQEFLKSYRRPSLFFSCLEGDGESHVIEEMTPSAFIATGGSITIFGNLVVHEAERSWQS